MSDPRAEPALPSDRPATIAVNGLGTTGSKVVGHLADLPGPTSFELCLYDIDERAVHQAVTAAEGRVATEVGPLLVARPPDVVVLATPCGTHIPLARRLLRAGSHVVSMSDAPADVIGLLELDDLARGNEVALVVGAGMAPGLSCLLARHAGDQLDQVDAINIAKTGTAGPACARQHHRALKQPGREWVGDGWELRHGGSGRDLAWFPEPIGARDCYRGALSSPILLHRRYPNAQRLSARVSATRRDRLTSRLPMLRKPHQDGGPGAIRAEVRGWRHGSAETIVYAVTAYPSSAAAAVAAEVAQRALAGQVPAGAAGLSEWSNAGAVLAAVRRRGINISTFGGVGAEADQPGARPTDQEQPT